MIDSQSVGGKNEEVAANRGKLLIYDSPSNELIEVAFDVPNSVKTKSELSDAAMNYIFFNQKNSINCEELKANGKDNQAAVYAQALY